MNTAAAANEVKGLSDRGVAEYDKYRHRAITNHADFVNDAIYWDGVATHHMVERLIALDGSSTSDADFRAGFRILWNDLVTNAAIGHAKQCELNGWPK